MLAVLHGHIGAAWAYNPLVFTSLGVVAASLPIRAGFLANWAYLIAKGLWPGAQRAMLQQAQRAELSLNLQPSAF